MAHTGNFTYDDLGRIIRQESGFEGSSHSISEFTYDNAGNVLSQRVSCGQPGEMKWRTARSTYDTRNRVVDSIVVDDGIETRSRSIYDAAGHVIESYTGMTDGGTDGAARMAYTYDKFGNVLTCTDPTGLTETCTYDRTGRLLSKTDRNGDTVTFLYDDLGWVLTEQVSTENTICSVATTRTYTYAKTGAKAGIIRTDTDPRTGEGVTRTIAYEYDDRGRMIRQADPDGIENTYAYDENGNRVSLRHPANGLSTTYAYNQANLITSLINSRNGTPLSSYEPNVLGKLENSPV